MFLFFGSLLRYCGDKAFHLKNLLKFTNIIAAFALLSSCNQKESQGDIEITAFRLFTNFEGTTDTLTLEMDLSKGPLQAVVLPGHGIESFQFQFSCTNLSGNAIPVAYKIYYQNKSYKHPEWIESWSDKKINPESSDNFYGSWIEDTLSGFRYTSILESGKHATYTDAFTISGNPRNELRYFGNINQYQPITEEAVVAMIDAINNSPDWLKFLVEKSKTNDIPLETLKRNNARWVLEHPETKPEENHRWKRNPRVGLYEFMLVAGSPDEVSKLPEYISNVGKTLTDSTSFTNPFAWFFLKDNEGIATVQKSNQLLKTFAVLRPNQGLYYSASAFNNKPPGSAGCSADSLMWEKAHFIQYVNSAVRDSSLNNIQAVADIVDENFNKLRYDELRKSSRRDNKTFVKMAEEPCTTVYLSENGEYITLENPGNTDPPYYKENAGVEGRFGFTYGKWRAKISFPTTMSHENVWNGVTCAYWLKFQYLEPWNNRSACENGGYVISGEEESTASYNKYASYSEIDIEIVKESGRWARHPYGSAKNAVLANEASENRNLVVACTNWDQACADPPKFVAAGSGEFMHGGKKFETNRWYRWYKAISIKTERDHDLTVGSPIWYEIDWRPDTIQWRIGTSPDAMDLVGYMDATGTKVPNNQMSPVMSQEWHYSHWWVTNPYPQGSLPYPKNPIKGMLFEIIIE